MTHEKFNNLSHREKIELIGKLVHLVQTDETCFGVACDMIIDAELSGTFDNIKILPQNGETIPDNQ